MQDLIQFLSKPLAHFVGSTIGEGNGDDLIDVEISVLTKDMKITLDENSGLPRARPSRHRDVFLDLVSGAGLFREKDSRFV